MISLKQLEKHHQNEEEKASKQKKGRTLSSRNFKPLPKTNNNRITLDRILALDFNCVEPILEVSNEMTMIVDSSTHLTKNSGTTIEYKSPSVD